MLYRPYTPPDFPALYAIEQVCFEPPLRFGRGYMRRLVNSARATTWVAEESGQMAGFSVADCTLEIIGLVAYIQTIEVLPSMRGRGIGSELLRRMENSVQDRGVGAIWLHVDTRNADAIRLYEAHGYQCEGRRENYYAHGRPALIYRKVLDPES